MAIEEPAKEALFISKTDVNTYNMMINLFYWAHVCLFYALLILLECDEINKWVRGLPLLLGATCVLLNEIEIHLNVCLIDLLILKMLVTIERKF